MSFNERNGSSVSELGSKNPCATALSAILRP